MCVYIHIASHVFVGLQVPAKMTVAEAMAMDIPEVQMNEQVRGAVVVVVMMTVVTVVRLVA